MICCRATVAFLATVTAMDPSMQEDLIRPKSSSGSAHSTSGSQHVGTATSVVRSIVHSVQSGLRTSEDMDYTGSLGIVGISKALLSKEVKIVSDFIAEERVWGSIARETREGWFNIMPSTEAMGSLKERLQQPQDYIQPREHTVDILESIQRLHPGEVYYLGKREVIPPGADLMDEGAALLHRELHACRNGWLVNRIDPLITSRDESCYKASADKGTAKHRELPTGALLNCLLVATQGEYDKLPNIDRKLMNDLLQIQADLDRNGLLDGKLVDEEEAEDKEHYWARNKDFADSVMQKCEQIISIWLMRAVPWFKFLQASADPCFYLLGRKRLSPEQTLEGLIVFRDKITMLSRYPDARYYEYNRLLAFHWGRALTRYFPDVFNGLRIEGDFWQSLSAFLLRPAGDPRLKTYAIPSADLESLWDLMFANGRPAVFAVYIASVQHARESYDAYMLTANRLRAEGADDQTWKEEMKRVMRVPEAVDNLPNYCQGEPDWEVGRIALQLTMTPIKLWFGSWEVPRVVELAKRIMAGRFSARSGFTFAGESPSSNRRSGVFSDLFRSSGSASDVRADASSALNRPIDTDEDAPVRKPVGGGGQNLFWALKRGGVRVTDDTVEKERPVATEINFATLVDMIDILVDDRMKESGQVLLDPHYGRREEVMTKLSTELGIESEFPTTMAAVEKAIAIITENAVGPELPVPEEGVELFSGLIDQLDPFSVVVDGVVRRLPDMTYEEMKNSLLMLKDTCSDGLERLGFDLHSTRNQRIPPDITNIVSGDKKDWFLTDLIESLVDSSSTMGAIPRGYLEALIRIRTASIDLVTNDSSLLPGSKEIITRDCEEILAIYAIAFAKSADSVSMYPHEMLKWCVELKSFLSNFHVVKAISLISNKITGISRFGPARAPEYVITFAQYAVGAYFAVNPSPDGVKRNALANKLIPIITEPSFGDLGRFWELMMREGRAGFVARIFAEIHSLVDRSMEIEDPLVDTKRILIQTFRLNVAEQTHIRFDTLVEAIDALVDGAMKRNQN